MKAKKSESHYRLVTSDAMDGRPRPARLRREHNVARTYPE